MPIYEYRCKECHQIFEEWTRQSGDESPRACPVCNSLSERIMSNTSFVLKGGGWYVTDYGFKSKDKNAADAPSSAASTPQSAASGGETKTSAPASAASPA